MRIKKAVTVIVVLLLANFVFAQEYTTYAASSNIKSQGYRKTDTVWILSNANNFLWNRIVEESVKNEFEKRNINVFLTTDQFDLVDAAENEYKAFYDAVLLSQATFILEIGIEDFNTYEYGGGVAKFDTVGNLVRLDADITALKIGLSTEADKNDMLSFNVTRKPSIESMAKALVDEYMRYAR